MRGEGLESTLVPERGEGGQDRVGAGPWPGRSAGQHCLRVRSRSRPRPQRQMRRLGVVRILIPPKDSVSKVIHFFICSKPGIVHPPGAE